MGMYQFRTSFGSGNMWTKVVSLTGYMMFRFSSDFKSFFSSGERVGCRRCFGRILEYRGGGVCLYVFAGVGGIR